MTTYPIPSSASAQTQAMLAVPAEASAFPPRGDTPAWTDYIRAIDEALFSTLPPLPPTVVFTERDIDGVRVYVHRPAGVAEGGRVYLDFHPGGLVLMGGKTCRLLGGRLADRLNIEVWSVDYRMPPQHPFPAGLDDALTAYRRLLVERSPSQIIVGGVSAGGNIAAALILRAKTEALPLPAALYLGTPEVDLTESGDSFAVNAAADNTLASLAEVNWLYADGADLADPYLSPLFGDVTGFPPTLLSTGTRDLYLSNTVRMHRKLRQAGVPAELHVFEAMPHSGPASGSPEELELRRELSTFIDSHLAHQVPGPR